MTPAPESDSEPQSEGRRWRRRARHGTVRLPVGPARGRGAGSASAWPGPRLARRRDPGRPGPCQCMPPSRPGRGATGTVVSGCSMAAAGPGPAALGRGSPRPRPHSRPPAPGTPGPALPASARSARAPRASAARRPGVHESRRDAQIGHGCRHGGPAATAPAPASSLSPGPNCAGAGAAAARRRCPGKEMHGAERPLASHGPGCGDS